jgi:hypothetical protein
MMIIEGMVGAAGLRGASDMDVHQNEHVPDPMPKPPVPTEPMPAPEPPPPEPMPEAAETYGLHDDGSQHYSGEAKRYGPIVSHDDGDKQPEPPLDLVALHHGLLEQIVGCLRHIADAIPVASGMRHQVRALEAEIMRISRQLRHG